MNRPERDVIIWKLLIAIIRRVVTDLRDQELGEAFRQPALLAGQNHLQHVAVELLHDDEHLLGRLEHAVQVNDPRVVQVLSENRSKQEQ